MKKNILKGFIIGIAKIIPGVSGSLLAISLGVYERVLGIIADFRNITWRKFCFILWLALGALVGVSLFSRGVKWLLDEFYFPTMLLFIGLIIGGLPEIWREIRGERFGFRRIIIFCLALTFSYSLGSLGTLDTLDSGNIFIYFGLGLLEAFSSIVPGISGTAIYMSLGCYDMLLDFFSNVFNPVYFKFGIAFAIGILVGVIILAKLITFLLKHYKVETYFAIFGFMAGSLIIMFKESFTGVFSGAANGFTILLFLLGIAGLFLGYKITIKINDLLASD